MSSPKITREIRLPPEAAGQRVDQALALALPEFSRSRLKAWLEAGCIEVAGGRPRPRDPVRGGELVRLEAVVEAHDEARPEAIPLEVRHEDDALLVICKPAGLVVHPGAGNPAGTLQNALLAREPTLARLPRAGIVHRLDKDTSGLLLVARTLECHAALVRMLEQRRIHREYQCVCSGVMTGGGTVDAPIGRHGTDRTRMTVRGDGRHAVTHYRVIERFRAHTHVRVQLETGRTHQIRVHLAHVGYPILGDPVYGRRLALPRGCQPAVAAVLRGFRRQALHAARLEFEHPLTGRPLVVEAPLPHDMGQLLDALRSDARDSGGRPGP